MERPEPRHGAGEGSKDESKDTLLQEANNSSAWILPMIIISLSLTVNTYMLSNVFPYVGVMVAQMLRLPSMNEAGFYAGFVASAFTFGRLLSSYWWGYASDVWGRKPVMIIALVSIAVLSLAFGLSESLAFAVGSRFVLGLFNGIMSSARTLSAEICGPENVVLGMSFLSVSRAAGLVIGPGIGGLLAQPAEVYPSVFSPTGLFARYPFLLPNLAGAVFSLMVLPLVVVFIPETRAGGARRVERKNLDTKAAQERGTQVARKGDAREGDRESSPADALLPRDARVDSTVESGATCPVNGREACYETFGREGESGDGSDETEKAHPVARCSRVDDEGAADSRSSLREQQAGASDGSGDNGGGLCGPGGLLRVPHVPAIIAMICLLSSVAIGLDEALPLWAISTTEVGGLGWPMSKIGQVLAMVGGGMILCQFLLFPVIVRRVGMVRLQRFSSVFSVILALLLPNVRYLSWSERATHHVLGVILLLHQICLSNVMSSLTIASTSVVEASRRGKLSGLVMTVESLGRFIGPASFSLIYAWSISSSGARLPLVDYRFVFLLPAVSYTIIFVVGRRVLTAEILGIRDRPHPDRPPSKVVPASALANGKEAGRVYSVSQDAGKTEESPLV